MDPIDKIYSNMEHASRQSGRWYVASILFSIILLSVSHGIISVKNEISFLGIKISITEIQFITVLILVVVIAYTRAIAEGVHEHYLQRILWRNKDKYMVNLDLSDKEWRNGVEVSPILSIMIKDHVIGSRSLHNIPGFLVVLSTGFAGILFPLFAVVYGAYTAYQVVGAVWWIILLCLFSCFMMLFLAFRGVLDALA